MVLAVQRGLEDTGFAMLWLISYTFLLRLPSEMSACVLGYHAGDALCDGRRYLFARRILILLALPRSNH